MMDDNITILIKLFDTLKESSMKNEASTQKLIMQQLELVSQIKNLPVEDLKTALKEHAKESVNNIDNCSGMIELKTADIMDMLRVILNKINKISLIVWIVLSVLSASYIIVKAVDSYTKSDKIEETVSNEKIEMINDIKKQLSDHIQESKNDNTSADVIEE
jgi:beta-lactamase regulating signal transducer with metallopeptidase domain